MKSKFDAKMNLMAKPEAISPKKKPIDEIKLNITAFFKLNLEQYIISIVKVEIPP